MDKLNFFDFIAYVVPGGTFLFVLVVFLQLNFPGFNQWFNVDATYTILPFLIFSYLIGHVFNSLGKIMEDFFYKDIPIIDYFKSEKKSAERLIVLADLVFGYKLVKEGKDFNKGYLKLFYSRVCDYLEVNEKDAKITTLSSQRLFFRNSSVMFIITALLILILYTAIYLGMDCLRNHLPVYHFVFVISLISIYPSFYYSRQKFLLIIRFTFRNFMALHPRGKDDQLNK